MYEIVCHIISPNRTLPSDGIQTEFTFDELPWLCVDFIQVCISVIEIYFIFVFVLVCFFNAPLQGRGEADDKVGVFKKREVKRGCKKIRKSSKGVKEKCEK